jgi:hypothetical protein
MSNEPTFPKEAAVGDEAPPSPPAASAAPDAPASAASGQRKHRVRTGVAVGIGSAAIVAALMYANRGRRSDRGER